MKKDIENLKKELVLEIKDLAADIASANSYIGLLSNEIKFRSLQEKFINLKFLERKQYGLEIFESSHQIEAFAQDDFDKYQEETINQKSSNQEKEKNLDSGQITLSDSDLENQEKSDSYIQEEVVETTASNTSKPDDSTDSSKSQDIADYQSYPPLQLDFNDQMAFQHQLFGGDAESLNMVIRTLNAINSPQDSTNYIADLQDEMEWNDKIEYVERLQELVLKRFE